jgi:hypothetical protein
MLSPSTGSSMVTSVWYTFTSDDAQSCMLETEATDRTCPLSILFGKASTRISADWPGALSSYSSSRYSSRSTARAWSDWEASRLNGLPPARNPARRLS